MSRRARKSKQGPSKQELVRHPDYATVMRTIVTLNETLLARHGAHHLGVSKKYRRGERRPETCITFYVRKKGKNVRAEKIPKRIALEYKDGGRRRMVATDVCAIGRKGPVGFLMRGGHVVIAGGASGTVGLVFEIGDADMFLTNAHVTGTLTTVRVRVPGGGTIPGNVVRVDDLAAPVIFSDAALVNVPNNSVSPGLFQGVDLRLNRCGDIANNDPRRFFYVAGNFIHEVRWRAFMPAASQIDINGSMLNYAGFHKFDVKVGQCAPGHSGAVLFCQTQGGLMAVGLLFGGIVATNEVWVFPIRLSLQQMGVDPDSL